MFKKKPLNFAKTLQKLCIYLMRLSFSAAADIVDESVSCESVVRAAASWEWFQTVAKGRGAPLLLRCQSTLLRCEYGPRVKGLQVRVCARELSRVCALSECEWTVEELSCVWRSVAVSFVEGLQAELRLRTVLPGWQQLLSSSLRSMALRNADSIALRLVDPPVLFRVRLPSGHSNSNSSSSGSVDFSLSHFGLVARDATVLVERPMRFSHRVESATPAKRVSCPRLVKLLTVGSLALLQHGTVSLDSVVDMVERDCNHAGRLLIVLHTLDALRGADNAFASGDVVFLLLGLDDVFGSRDEDFQLPELKLFQRWLRGKAQNACIIAAVSDPADLHRQMVSCFPEGLRCEPAVEIRHGPAVGYSVLSEHFDQSIVGQERAKKALRSFVAPLLSNLSSRADALPQRVVGCLVVGACGTGKSLICSSIVSNAAAGHARSVSVPSLVSAFVGESERSLSALFAEARENGPSILVFDDIHELFGREHSRERSLLTTLKHEMATLPPDAIVLLLATSKSVQDVDESLLQSGIFDATIELEMPDSVARETLLSRVLPKRMRDELSSSSSLAAFVQDLVRKTQGLSHAQITRIVRRAAIASLVAGQSGHFSVQQFEEAAGSEERSFVFDDPGNFGSSSFVFNDAGGFSAKEEERKFVL
jgi:AAA+ superfamily predicted ATPase